MGRRQTSATRKAAAAARPLRRVTRTAAAPAAAEGARKTRRDAAKALPTAALERTPTATAATRRAAAVRTAAAAGIGCVAAARAAAVSFSKGGVAVVGEVAAAAGGSLVADYAIEGAAMRVLQWLGDDDMLFRKQGLLRCSSEQGRHREEEEVEQQHWKRGGRVGLLQQSLPLPYLPFAAYCCPADCCNGLHPELLLLLHREEKTPYIHTVTQHALQQPSTFPFAEQGAEALLEEDV